MAVWLMLVLLAVIAGAIGATVAAWWLVAIAAVVLIVGLVLGGRRGMRESR